MTPDQFTIPPHACARLRMPALREMLLLWYPRATRTLERSAIFIPAEIERLLDTVDGEAVDRERARRIHADRSVLAAFWQARNHWLDASSGSGLLLAQCPHCRKWEADLTPMALAIGLRVPFWPTIDDDQCLAVPALASELSSSVRSATPPASRLGFVLPASRLDLESSAKRGSFTVDALPPREAAIDNERARLRADDPDTYGDWDAGFAGVRSMLKLGALLEELDGGVVTLDRVADLALCDFFFLDNLYYLTHAVSVPDDSPLHLSCANCGGRFAPVR